MIDDPACHRQGTPAQLAAALADARQRFLVLLDAWQRCLPRGMEIRYAAELNPPRWEFGHVAWFEEFWIARNPLRRHGVRARATSPRAASWWPAADQLYDSSAVAHTRRWQLDLPSIDTTRRYAAVVRERTLALLAQAETGDDDTLYPFRLALAHEDMHREAWIYMAQHLALAVADALPASAPAPIDEADDGRELALPAATHRLGSEGAGFAFDNELGAHDVALDAFAIDAAPVSWRRFLPFVDAGGYRDPQWWSADGWAWRQRANLAAPRYLQRDESGRWQRACFGRWTELDERQPAVNLSGHEAEAWCRWAGRRLPTEAEWEHAALTQPGAFRWGQVWEWTASPFAPYPDFAPHPYADYSQPWFDGRPVLRGASFATARRLAHAKYRNYFPPGRNDVFAGLRSCAAR